MNNGASIEKIHNYYEAAKFLDENGKKDLQKLLGITESDMPRLSGLENETEFLLMIFLLGNVKEITGIDESNAPLTKTKTTDVFIETNSNRKFSVEIKSSNKSEIKFTRKLVEDKVVFSQSYGREAYFAIKLSGHWMFFSAEYILSKNCKISIENDLLHSELDDILGERVILFPKGLELLTTYSHKENMGIGFHYKEYGNAVRIAMKIFGKREFIITSSNTDFVFMSCVLENVEDVMSNQYQEIKRLDTDRTLVIEKFTEETNLLKLSVFLMAPIRHMLNTDTDSLHTFQTFKEELKTEKNPIDRALVLASLNLLSQRGYPLIVFINGKGYDYKDIYGRGL